MFENIKPYAGIVVMLRINYVSLLKKIKNQKYISWR
jgi:hypothetical protein